MSKFSQSISICLEINLFLFENFQATSVRQCAQTPQWPSLIVLILDFPTLVLDSLPVFCPQVAKL